MFEHELHETYYEPGHLPGTCPYMFHIFSLVAIRFTLHPVVSHIRWLIPAIIVIKLWRLDDT